jgi:hypothetical protein
MTDYSKFEVRVMVRLLQAEENQSAIHQRLVNVYGQNIFQPKESYQPLIGVSFLVT